MTIQPFTSLEPITAGPAAAKNQPAPKTAQPTPQDTIQLSKKAQAALDLDHDGDSH